MSVVLAAHREGALLQRTLLSLREAARYARAEGITIELVAALDRADELTRKVKAMSTMSRVVRESPNYPSRS